MKKIPLAEAGDDQLRTFAETVLNLDIAGLKTRSKLIGAIGPAWDKDYILAEGSDEAPQTEQNESPTVYVAPENDYSSILKAPPITIKVMTTGNYGGKDDVFVSVNTKPLRLARGVPVKLPYPYFEALQNAVCATTTQAEDPTADMIETESSNYPCQVLVPVDEAAWAAFQVATAKVSLYA